MTTAALGPVATLSDEERRSVLEAARGPEPAAPLPDFVEQFRSQVARRRGHNAVEADDGVLTYGELDRITDALAGRLRALGVGPECRVGVAIPRGARELAALLATLKAGGAYVPLDPTHPVERIRVILGDAAPQVLIAPTDLPFVAAMPAGVSHLAFDRLSDAATWEGVPSDLAPPTPDQLAYVLFTSGSTGRPKGVEILRGALANLLRALTALPGFYETDRILAITTTTFDIAGLELFLPLWVGGTTIIADRDTVVDPRLLRARIERERPSVLQATPATWRLLLEAGWRGHPELRMITGGEALNPTLADRLLPCGSELWNLYGPTETTIWSLGDRIRAEERPIMIGRPLDFTQVYVLDGDRELVAPDVVGEIYIAGHGLGRGYLGRPDLTEERFVPAPMGPPGTRMYRTGDLGRLRSDGRFECLGRIDHQVKIRGFRIELGEIESTFRAVPGVTEVLVVAIQRPDSDPSLSVYWTGDATREALYEEARARLPSYMVPAAFANLPAFPLNTNGKIDRGALPAPTTDLVQYATGPRNSAEARMAAIWSEVLHVGAVGIDQDFFALGGNSAKVVEARAKIEQAFAVELPLRAFFESPTIEHLVAKLGQHTSDAPITVSLQRGRADLSPLHCLLGIDLYHDLARALGKERTVYGIHVPMRYRPAVESRPGVEEVATRYAAAVRGLQPRGPYLLAGFCFGGVVAFEVARQLEAAGERVPVIALFDADLPGGNRIRWRAAVLELARRALRDPGELFGKLRARGDRARVWLRTRIARISKVLPRSGPVRSGAPAPTGAASLDPERETEVQIGGGDDAIYTAHYERHLGHLRTTQLLVFRAIARDLPEWINQADHLGWQGHAPKIATCAIESDHVALLQPPHVAKAAALIVDAIAAAEAEGKPTQIVRQALAPG